MGMNLSRNFSGRVVSNSELLRRYEEIKPVVTINNQKYLLYGMDLDMIKNEKEVLFSRHRYKVFEYIPFPYVDLSFMRDEPCIVLAKGTSNCEVSVATILSQIPKRLLDKAVAFSVTNRISLVGYDSYVRKAKKNNCVIFAVNLYRKRTKLELLDDKKLEELNNKIIPIIEKNGKKYTTYNNFSLKEVKGKGYFANEASFAKEVEPYSLSEITCVEMLHRYCRSEVVNPTIAEILSQIPDEYLEKTIAYEVVEYAKFAADFLKHKDEFDDGFHVSKVVLYKKAEE